MRNWTKEECHNTLKALEMLRKEMEKRATENSDCLKNPSMENSGKDDVNVNDIDAKPIL